MIKNIKHKWLIKMCLCIVVTLIFSRQGYSQENNIAQYRIVTHSSSIDANQTGHLVVDGNSKTYWEAHYKDKNQFLLIDLNSKQKANTLTIEWGVNFATEYTISIISDHKSEEVFSTDNGTGGNQVLDLQGKEVQFVRIDISDVNDTVRGCSINEVVVLGQNNNRFKLSEVNQISANNLSLNNSKWRVQSTAMVNESVAEISNTGYNDTKWIPAKVPGTILGDYYNFGALPDPLYGDNMHQISDEFFSGNDFWYRTEVQFSSELANKKIYLNFSGINYKSDIYINGKQLGRIEGGFLRGEYEVSDFVNLDKPNTIAVLVHHNDNWVSGTFKILKKKLGSRISNGDMLGLDGPTSLASAGWNWLPIIKGRNNGIWNNVNFRVGGSISIKDPWVSTKFQSKDLKKADLTISTELKNSSSKAINGKLIARLNGKIRLEVAVTVAANETKTVTLDKSKFSKLSIKKPKLWWPNGYGEQILQDLDLEFIVDGKISDKKNIKYGIRELEYKIQEGVLFIYCNNTRILLKGGNWGLPEAMMRMDYAGYDLRVKLHKDANFNMIRNWIGMTNHEEFYQACDKYGVLIFDDFWLANPKNGPNPNNLDLFMENAKDKIKWVRKHPSLAFYCGRNEGIPLLEYDQAMKKQTELLDGTRHYVQNSAAGTLSGYGPYEVKTPEWYFKRRGATLHSEIGIIAIPEIESLRKMMPKKDLWPISDMWSVHNYQDSRSHKYTDDLEERYGKATSAVDYSNKAQLLNYETGKAMFETLQSKQGSGMILWMSQSAWPSLICQLYDHYLEYTASYFAVKKGSSNIHAFWDIDRNEIRVANNTREDIKKATIKATIFDAQGNVVWSQEKPISITSTSVKTSFPLVHTPADKVLYLKLELTRKGKVLSDNFYWLENKNKNCLDLNDLPKADIKLNIVESSENNFYTAKIKLTNSSGNISLLNKIKLKDKVTGESILPVHFDDDYVSLLPNEVKTINIKVDKKYLKNKNVEMHLEGWNTKGLKLDINKK
ncbi:discoidin domain-containing protein [Polaribacter sp. Z014]|uniref:glycosyl hydrolase 2 galactose-binding domain-containing protein n=1 Tax=Polaribacter sp. Z014 TaxID=2927126 RepID=UPI002021857E|nr:discoidin domain-containing protein [Polaribacter sp. Z014]MCL7762633.1 discoidin domain-containing protein [Polaribacter sp. Z014]